jgi:hypothetical protein
LPLHFETARLCRQNFNLVELGLGVLGLQTTDSLRRTRQNFEHRGKWPVL